MTTRFSLQATHIASQTFILFHKPLVLLVDLEHFADAVGCGFGLHNSNSNNNNNSNYHFFYEAFPLRCLTLGRQTNSYG